MPPRTVLGMGTPSSGTIDIPGLGPVDWRGEDEVDDRGGPTSRVVHEAKRADGTNLTPPELSQVKRQLDAR